MPLRKKFGAMLLTTSIAAIVLAMPFRVTLKGWGADLSAHSAFAKDGNGRGGGEGKGGSHGNGNGKGGGNGKSGGKGKDASAGSAAKNAATGRHVNPSTGDLVQVSGTNIEVLHRNGMRERVQAGRYLMKDGRGRTIVERRATGADVSRLRGMMD